jgi:hypothetical protein
MPFEVSCQCGQRFLAQDHLRGQRLPCPACGAPLSIEPSAEHLLYQLAPLESAASIAKPPSGAVPRPVWDDRPPSGSSRGGRRFSWLGALREELFGTSFGSVTAVFAVVFLLAALCLFVWSGVSQLSGRPPEVIRGTCIATQIWGTRDRATGQEKPFSNAKPFSTVQFVYKDRKYQTNSFPPFSGADGKYFRPGDEVYVWVFDGQPAGAYIAPGSWSHYQANQARMARRWAGTWIALGLFSLMLAAILAALAALRLNAVRQGARHPYALSFRLE